MVLRNSSLNFTLLCTIAHRPPASTVYHCGAGNSKCQGSLSFRRLSVRRENHSLTSYLQPGEEPKPLPGHTVGQMHLAHEKFCGKSGDDKFIERFSASNTKAGRAVRTVRSRPLWMLRPVSPLRFSTCFSSPGGGLGMLYRRGV